MASHLCLIICANFDREILALQSSPEFRDVRFKTLAVDCDQVEAGWNDLGENVEACRRQGCAVCLVGSYCLVRAAKELGLDQTCAMSQKSQCFEWVADKEILDRFLQEGALPVLPGWLKNWERNVDMRWPSARKEAQAYFRQLANKVLLLDTGVYPKVDHDLKSFARFLRLPFEIFPAGVGHFKLSLGQIVLSWRAEKEREGAEDQKAAIRRQMSEYARMGQLLGAVTGARGVEDVRAGTLELFRVLLSPQEVVFHSAESLSSRPSPEGSPLDRIIALSADYAWTDDRRTLFLRISHEREFLGVLEVTGLGDGERRDHNLNLALALARISGLALMNVKNSLALMKERDKAAEALSAFKAGEEKMTTIFSYPLGLYRTTPQGRIVDAAPTLARMLGYQDVASLKAVNFWDLHDNPADRETWQSVLGASPFVEIFETKLRRRDGTLFWVRESTRAAKDPRGNVLFYDGVIEDITKKKQMEGLLSWDERLRASVSALSERLLLPTRIEEMSAFVMDQARRLTSSATSFVGYVDARTSRLVPAAMTPDAQEMLRVNPDSDGALHEASGMWGWVLRNKKAILTNMTSLDPRFTGMPEWHFPVRHFLAAPAVMAGRIVGLIVVANPESPFVERDLEAVERLATLYAIAVHRTRTEQELRDLSLVDELTKLYNRRGFMTLAEQQLKVAHRTKKELSLFYADLDDLKKINDSFGHDEGDSALVEAAGLLREVFRDSDIIARIGGDEFVVLAIDIAEGKAASLTRRLREKVAARNARPARGYAVSFSLGVARYDPDEPSSLQELLTVADRKMYQDKSARKLAPATA